MKSNNKKHSKQRFLKAPSFYTSNAWLEYTKFFIGSIVVAFLAYYLFNYIIPDSWKSTDFLAVLLALLLGASISFLIFSGFHYSENYLAFQYMHRFTPSWKDILINKNKKIFDFIIKEYNSLLYDIVRLPNEAVKSTYTNQIKIASIFNSLSETRFWATSFDLPSQFYAKNSDYFTSMSNLSEIKGIDASNNIPNKARIFVCPLDEFIEDIYHNPKKFKELIEWHLQWHKKTNVNIENSPIRFYFYNDSKMDIIDRFFDKIQPDSIIPDFMIVDNKLVYGRIENKAIYDNSVTLKAITKKSIKRKKYIPKFLYKKTINEKDHHLLSEYENVFKEIYDSSIEPIDIIDLLNHNLDNYKEQMEKIDKDLTLKKGESFSGQYYRLDDDIISGVKEFINNELIEKINNYNKLQNIDNHYGEIFKNNTKGANFTKKWLDLMNNSSKLCVAIDTADNRGGSSRFLDKWQNDDGLYKQFLISGSNATIKNRTIFKRVFILDDKIDSEDQLRFAKLLNDCINIYKLEIGFVFLKDLKDKKIIKDNDIHSNTDFILLNINRENITNINTDKNVYGFRITKGDEFLPEKLNYENNLIDPRDFKKFYNIFEKIYSVSTKFSSDSDIINKEKVSLFIKNDK